MARDALNPDHGRSWINTQVEDSLRARVEAYARREDRTLSSVVRLALRQYLDRVDRENGEAA